jgi:hypothetical protein
VSTQYLSNLRVLSTQATNSLEHGKIGFARSVPFQTLSSDYSYAPIRGKALGEGIDKSSLADASFPCHKNDLPFPRNHLVAKPSHLCKCVLAADNSRRTLAGLSDDNGFVAFHLMIASQHLAALTQLTDESVSSTMRGFDEAWRLWIIVKSLSQLANRDFEHGFGDKGSRPDGVEQFLFGYKLSRTVEEVKEHGERLWPELYGF